MPQEVQCDRCQCLRRVEQLGLTRFKCLVCRNEFSTIASRYGGSQTNSSSESQPYKAAEQSRRAPPSARAIEDNQAIEENYHRCPSCLSLRPVIYLSHNIAQCRVCGDAFQLDRDAQQRKDLQELIRSQEQQRRQDAVPLPQPTTPTGGVYLLKRGAHFKVGKATNFDQRIQQVRLQLPEKVVEIHRIYTDDPFGIESYWHRRFASKRLNGEWFALTEEDIEVFEARTRI